MKYFSFVYKTISLILIQIIYLFIYFENSENDSNGVSISLNFLKYRINSIFHVGIPQFAVS